MGVRVDLTGRRVAVTGASSGIGAATCRSIVGCGGAVAMIARRQERLDELREELGDRAVGIRCDVTDPSLLEGAIAQAARDLGGLDGAIAVAGRTMAGSITSGSPDRWRELLDLNLVAPLATVRYTIGHFPPTGRRDVVLVGSTGAVTPMPGVGIYGASKRGLRAAFDSLRLELAPSGINVSIVMPGMFETEGLTLEKLEIDGEIPANDIPMFVSGTGPASPDSLADAIAFMISLPEGVCINELIARPTGQLHP
jgi:NADP-dependent 3-hydroxy acid dehydrogenase YdfG